MGYLLQLLLAVAAQATAQTGVHWWGVPAVWSLPLLGLPYLVGACLHRSTVRGRFKLAVRCSLLLSVCAPASFAFLVFCTDWLDRVRGWTGAELGLLTWPELSLIVVLAPFVLLQVLAIDAESRAQEYPGRARGHAMRFRVRMFLAGLIPLAACVIFSAPLGWYPLVRENVRHVALLNGAYVGTLLVVMAFGLPRLLVAVWDTKPMPEGPQRMLLEAVADRARFTCRSLRVWNTGGQVANAAILGLGPTKFVLFSDSLLSMLDRHELAAVYGHEIGHSKKGHVLLFLTWSAAIFMGGDLLIDMVLPESVWLPTVALLGLLIVWALAFGWLSRRCELQADLYSLRLLSDPAGLVSALERVAGPAQDSGGWRHFSVRKRSVLIMRAAEDASFARRFGRHIRLIAILGALLFVLVSAIQLRRTVAEYRPDRARAQLALGHYEGALDWASTQDEELLRLARLGVDIMRGTAPEDAPVLLRQAGMLALEQRDYRKATDCATLLGLRGDRDAYQAGRLVEELSRAAPAGSERGPILARLETLWGSASGEPPGP